MIYVVEILERAGLFFSSRIREFTMRSISLLSSLLLLFSGAQAQEILLVPVIQFGLINVEITLVSTPAVLSGLQATPVPILPLAITAGPLASSNSLQVTFGSVTFLVFSLSGGAIPAGSSGVLAVATYPMESAGQEVCLLNAIALSDPTGTNILPLFSFEECVVLPEIPSPPPPSSPPPPVALMPPIPAEALATLRLTSLIGFESDNVVELILEIKSPIVGIQFDYDLSSADKLVPDQVFPGSLFVEKGYSFSEGPLGLLAFSFSLDEILPEENPTFTAATLVFEDPISAADQQFCFDDGDTDSVVTALMGVALVLDFPMGPCITFPAVVIALEVSGLTLSINVRNSLAVSGSQFQFEGPDGFEILDASNGPLYANAGFGNPASGTDIVLSFSLQANSVPPQTTFGNLINIEFNLPGNYCFLVDDSEVAGVAGTEISFVFVNDDNCFRLVLPDNSCPTAGTGDVNDDGVITIQDIVEIINLLVSTVGTIDPCTADSADVSSDGMISVADIVLLITAITG